MLRLQSARLSHDLGPSTVVRTSSFRPFSSSIAARKSHYEELGVSRGVSKKELKERFYELSKKYHPDAPSSSASEPADRLAKFQSLSHAYSVLSDDVQRRQYDLSLSSGGGGMPQRQNRYTRAATSSRAAGGGSSYTGAGRADWSESENEARRERANYAWRHPRNNPRSQQASSGPSEGASGFSGSGGATADDHYDRFAAREARIRWRSEMQAKAANLRNESSPHHASPFQTKAQLKENELINDSGVRRSGSVLSLFAGMLVLGFMLSPSKPGDKGHRAKRT